MVEPILKAQAADGGIPENITLVDSSADHVLMGDMVPDALRRVGSSMERAFQLLKDGEADAFMSAGNSAAVVAFAHRVLRYLPGITSPAIIIQLPTKRAGKRCLLLDAGGITGCTPQLLVSWLRMAKVMAEILLEVENPVISLHNIGSEEDKGNELVKKTYRLAKASAGLRSVKLVEPRDYFGGTVDAVICDGFTGNTILKVAEAVAELLLHWIREAFGSSFFAKLVGAMARPYLKSVKTRLDPNQHGGAILAGINGVTVIAHGSASEVGVANAILFAAEAARQELHLKIGAALAPAENGGGADGDESTGTA